MRLTRRAFLQALSASAAAPYIFVPRRARAQTQSGTARARQLLIIYCAGGMRSHTLFSFAGAPVALNPFGFNAVKTSKAEFMLPSPLPDDDSLRGPFSSDTSNPPSWGSLLIGNIYDKTEQFSLLAPVDHNPGADAEINRQRARNIVTTGHPEGGAGLLTIIGNKLPDQRSLPAFVIGAEAAGFGATAPGLEANAPVYIPDPLAVFSQINGHPTKGKIDDWELAYRRSVDEDYGGKLPGPLANVVAGYGRGHEQRAALTNVLSLPQLQFGQDTTATATYEKVSDRPLENRMLEQLFLPFIKTPFGTNTSNSDYSDPLGSKMALAFRLLQYGSPAVAVGFGDFDLHSNEKEHMRNVAAPLGRAISGLLFILSKMKGVQAKRRLDEVLVVVVSDFGRDNVNPNTGFNDAGGSDHYGENSCRYQVLPIFGAGIKGGKVFGGTSHSTDLTPLGKVYATRSLCATMIDALGIHDYRAFIDADPIEDIYL